MVSLIVHAYKQLITSSLLVQTPETEMQCHSWRAILESWGFDICVGIAYQPQISVQMVSFNTGAFFVTNS